MRWIVSATGMPADVAAAIDKQFECGKCSEPLESVRQSTRATIAAALAAQSPATAVKVVAYGSRSASGSGCRRRVGHSVTVQVEPIYGFVE